MPDDQRVRVNKYLAQAGLCSRRDADRLIREGRVSIEGRLAQPGDLVTAGDVVSVNGKTVNGPQQKLVYAFYKPVGVTCTDRINLRKRRLRIV